MKWITVLLPIAVMLVPTSEARAGAYQVFSCGDAPGNVNNAWIAINNDPGHLEQGSVCPVPQGAAEQQLETSGLYSADRLGLSNGSSPGSFTSWNFSASSGAQIIQISYRRYMGKNLDDTWKVGLSADGMLIPAESCSISGSASGCTVGGASSTQDLSLVAGSVSVGVTCAATQGVCGTGSSLHHVWAALYAATVTISDPVPPTLGAVSGTLVSAPPSAFHNGADFVTIPASDNVGVKQTTVYVDGQPVSTIPRGCDYTYVVPCSNESGAVHQVNWPALGVSDGSHQLQLAATDAAGNETRSPATSILVDTHAPTAPLGLTGVGRQAAAAFHLAWTNPDQGQGAPIVRADYRACPQAGRRPCLSGNVQGSGVRQATIVIPTRGSWRAAIWLTDGAGNANPANAATGVLDLLAPSGLRADRATLLGRELTVIGRAARGDTGWVRASYMVRVRGRSLALRATATLRHGHFRIRLHLPADATVIAGARVVLSYTGDRYHAPARASLRVRHG